MKNIYLLIIGFLLSINCFPQKKNIYNETLERFSNLLDSAYNWKTDAIYIEEMKGITDSFPSVVGKYKIIVLNSDEKQKILKANGKVYIYRFLPFVFKDGVFKVELSGFSCKLDGSAVVNAGYRYSFIYDYQKNRFVFSKFEGGGI